MWVSGEKIDEDDGQVFGVKESVGKLQRVRQVLETMSLTSKMGRYINWSIHLSSFFYRLEANLTQHEKAEKSGGGGGEGSGGDERERLWLHCLRDITFYMGWRFWRRRGDVIVSELIRFSLEICRFILIRNKIN